MNKFKIKKFLVWMMTLVLCCNMMCIEGYAETKTETDSTDGSDSGWIDGTQTVSLSLDKDSIMLGESVTISVEGDYYGEPTLTANGSPIDTSYTPNAVGTVGRYWKRFGQGLLLPCNRKTDRGCSKSTCRC